MMNQYEAAVHLLHDLPELSQEINIQEQPAAIYKAVQVLMELTCVRVREHNYKAVKHCFLLAGRLYEQGNAMVQRAVENVFVYSLDRIFSNAGSEQAEVRGMVPVVLYTSYVQQVLRGGC